MRLILPALVAALVLVGCTSRGSFPSLAKRPFETAQPPARPAPTAVPSDAALLARIARFVGDARAGTAAFERAADAARPLAAGAGAPASESWIAAQTAISGLEPLTAPARDALAALDQERVLLGSDANPADRAALEAAIGDVEGIAARQTAMIESLLALVNRR